MWLTCDSILYFTWSAFYDNNGGRVCSVVSDWHMWQCTKTTEPLKKCTDVILYMCVCVWGGGGGGGGRGMTRELNALQLHNYYYKPPMPLANFVVVVACWQEIGHTHMRIAEGVQSLLQMSGLLARLCQKAASPDQLAQWRTHSVQVLFLWARLAVHWKERLWVCVVMSLFTCTLKKTMTRKFWFLCARVQVCFCEFVYLRFERKKTPWVWVSVSLFTCALKRILPTSSVSVNLFICALKTTTHKFGWGNVFERNTTTHKFVFFEPVYLCIKNNNPQVWFLWARLPVHWGKKQWPTSLHIRELVYLCIKKPNDPQVQPLWACSPVHWKKTSDPQVHFLGVCLPVHWEKQPTSLVCVSLFTCALKIATHRFSFCELILPAHLEKKKKPHNLHTCELVYCALKKKMLVYQHIEKNNPQVWFLWVCLPVH